MYLLGVKQTNVFCGNSEKTYIHPVEIVKASTDKQDIYDKVKELVLNGCKQNRLMMLEEVPFGIDIIVK